jgi:hypothetical protein
VGSHNFTPQEEITNMIYSFLSQELNEELNLVPDVITERKEVGNYFMFEFDNGALQVTEVENNYDDKDVVNEYIFPLKQGDELVAVSMAGLTVLKLLKFGVKISLYDFDYQDNRRISWLVSND